MFEKETSLNKLWHISNLSNNQLDSYFKNPYASFGLTLTIGLIPFRLL